MNDPHDLSRFVEAQAPVFEQVLRELAAGRKQSHWMWFVFPQIAGLGHSPMAQRYAIGSLAEAEAYVAHELLGPRLAQCTDLVNRVTGRSIVSILGQPDDMKFRSSMTLFSRATADNRRMTIHPQGHISSSKARFGRENSGPVKTGSALARRSAVPRGALS